jgi:hypothetical protein
MQLSFRLDKRPGESHLALDGKKENMEMKQNTEAEPQDFWTSNKKKQVAKMDLPSLRL